MIALLQHFSLSNIIIFAILLALAIKSLVSFFDWAHERLKIAFDKQHNILTDKEKLERRLQKGSQIMDALQQNQEETDKILQKLSEKIDILIDSDKDAIKSFITNQHHYFCYTVGWIDDFSLDCIERRFKHYEEEGGNSFIENFMNELRDLPKMPPQMVELEKVKQ